MSGVRRNIFLVLECMRLMRQYSDETCLSAEGLSETTVSHYASRCIPESERYSQEGRRREGIIELELSTTLPAGCFSQGTSEGSQLKIEAGWT